MGSFPKCRGSNPFSAILKMSNIFLYSPLEQFDNVSWVYLDKTFQNKDLPLAWLNIFELDFGYTSTPALHVSQTSNLLIVLAVLAVIYFAVSKMYPEVALNLKNNFVSLNKDFSWLFFLTFLALFTGFVVFFWFTDVFSSLVRPYHLAANSTNLDSYSFFELTSIEPIINFSIAWDETFITFLAGFFLLGGSEEEDDEDFILEQEESTFIEDVVAPLFIVNIGKNVEDNGALFLKVCTIFGFVLTCNLIGMIPYSDTATSSLLLTFWVALTIFGSLLYLMIRRNGINYFFNLFLPAGSPLPLMFLLIPLEFFSYTFRLVSLSVRLFANMMAGHTLLKVIVGFSWTMLLMGDFFLIVNLFPLAILFALTFLEIGVAIVQAYIFTTLTCIYLKDIFVGH